MKKNYKEQKQKVSFWMPTSKLEVLMKEYKTESITDLFNQLVDDKIEHNWGDKDDTRSVITSIGAKNKLAKRIISYFPPEHKKIYIEPFGNTGSILFKKGKYGKEIFNDINEDVINFFRILQRDPLSLYNELIQLPYAESIYQEMLAASSMDPLERAVRFFYINRAGFLPSSGSNCGFQSNASNGRDFARFYQSEITRFHAISKRLQGVEILNRDFKRVIKAYVQNPDAFFLCDPPYYEDGSNYYEHNFKLKDHSVLAHLLAPDVSSARAIILHSKNYQIHKLYTGLGYRFETIRTKYASKKAIIDADGKQSKPESLLYLYLNY